MLAAGSVAGVELEDKEASDNSPAEEPTVVTLQLKAVNDGPKFC